MALLVGNEVLRVSCLLVLSSCAPSVMVGLCQDRPVAGHTALTLGSPQSGCQLA